MATGRERGGSWRVRLAAAAEEDFREIIEWPIERFGQEQAQAYAETVVGAIDALTAGPSIIGVKARDEIAAGIRTLHVARSGRKGRHFLAFRVARDGGGEVIEVLRILHDAMDLPRHLPAP